MQLFINLLSALLGIVFGSLLTIAWHRSRRPNDDQCIEPTYPPKLTLIERQVRTGTDPDRG